MSAEFSPAVVDDTFDLPIEGRPGVAKPDPILVADSVRRAFGGLVAVDVDHAEIGRGQITALIGPNGAGKTTFFNLLTGFDEPNSGQWTFDGRRVALGVSGGIAAYKAVEVCRRLVDAGAHVAPILTEGALRFVGRTTFDALASERAHTSLWDDEHPIPHTHLGQRAECRMVGAREDESQTVPLHAFPQIVRRQMDQHAELLQHIRAAAKRCDTAVPMFDHGGATSREDKHDRGGYIEHVDAITAGAADINHWTIQLGFVDLRIDRPL